MQDALLAIFTTDFQREVVFFQGFLAAALTLFWLVAGWETLVEQISRSRLALVWSIFCLILGGTFTVGAGLDWGPEYLLVAVSYGLGIALAMIHPAIAVCLQTSLLFLRPWELIDKNDYFGVLPKLTFSICAGHAIWLVGKRRGNLPEWSRSSSLLFLFACWAYITTFVAANPVDSQFRFFEALFKSVLLYFMITNALKTKKDLELLVGSLIITFLGVGAVSIYQTRGISEASAKIRLLGIGAFSNSNDIAALMVMIFPFGFMAFMRKETSRAFKAIAALLMAVDLWCLVLSESRGAMLALAMAMAVYVALKIKNKYLTVATVVLSLLAAPIFSKLSNRSAEDTAESSSSRLTYIKTGLNMAVRNPIFGVGYESYEENFERYATEILYEWGHRTAHNSWILALAETGFVGFGLFVALFVTAMRLAWRVFPWAPEYFLGLMAYANAFTFLSHSYLIYPYLMYGLINVAGRIYIPVQAPSLGLGPALPELKEST